MSRIFRFRIAADQRLVRADSIDEAKQIARKLFGAHNVKASIVSWFPSCMGPQLTPVRAYDAWVNAIPAAAKNARDLRAMQTGRVNRLAGFYRPQDTVRIKAKAESMAKAALAILQSM